MAKRGFHWLYDKKAQMEEYVKWLIVGIALAVVFAVILGRVLNVFG